MSETFNLEKFTVEEGNKLFESGSTSAQDLLGSVVRASTSKYNPDTQKSEPSKELIDKQTKLAQLCFAEGARLKDVFKNIYEIPASFIENNLPLIIESQFYATEVLQHITLNLYGLNDPLSLITKLIDDHKADTYKISYISSALDSSSIELLLNKGMKGDTLLRAAFENNNQKKQKELLELAFKHGASTSFFKNLNNISAENLNEDVFKLLIDTYKVPAQDLLNVVVRASTSQYNQANQKSEPNKDLIAKQTALTNFLIGSGAELKDVTNFSSDFVKNNLQLIIESKAKLKAESLNLDSLTIEELQTLLKHNITPQELFKKVLRDAEDHDGPLSEESINKLKNLIGLARSNNFDTNKVFSEYFKAHKENSNLINQDIFKYLLTNKLIDATLALEYAIRKASIDLANITFDYQPNINAKSPTSNLTLLNKALLTEDMDIVDWLLDKGVKHDVDYVGYLEAIESASFDNACKIVQRFPEIYNQDKTYEFLREDGSSIGRIKYITDYYNLIVDYLGAMQGTDNSLNDLERCILTPGTTIDVDNASIATNIYGYSPLHLAIIADKYDLAQKMIEAGSDIYAFDNNGISVLQLVILATQKGDNEKTNDLKQLKKLIATKIDNVDILFDNGKSLVDSFIEDSELASIVLSKTQDPLFYFYKPGSTPSNLNPEKVHIAIGHDEDLGHSNMSHIARSIMQNNRDIEFHFVSYKALKKGGDNFIKQFDAFINEGTLDVSYPESIEFTTNNYSFSTPTEQLYQLILQKTDELKIPYLGICGSAHALSLYHQGSMAPIKGYDKGQHEIEFIKGTGPYFLSLSLEQQEQALRKGTFPVVKVKGETRSNHSVVKGKVGKDMLVGAVSEDQVPMAFVDKSGIRMATQYHPEAHYHLPSAKHEKAWLDNFVVLARLQHNHKVHGTVSPSECLQFVKEQLAQFTPVDTTSSVGPMGDIPEMSDL